MEKFIGGCYGDSFISSKEADAKVVLWQSAFYNPITICASTNANVILCLYDNDVDLRLIKIDKNKRYTPPSSNSVISTIVVTSSCGIEEATGDDWQEFLTYLRGFSSGNRSFQSSPGVARSYRTPESILRALEFQHVK
jgi:hypothetical protein